MIVKVETIFNWTAMKQISEEIIPASPTSMKNLQTGFVFLFLLNNFLIHIGSLE